MPSFLQILDKLKDNNENFQVNCLNFGVLSFLHGLLPGSYTSLENGNPAIYTGLFVVIFVLAYFACKNVNKKEKILVGAFLLIMFLIMNIQVANIFMHAFDEPDWFEFRYSYVFSFLMAIVAVLAINNNCIQDFKGKNIIFICLNLFVVIYSGFTHIIINIFNETSLQKYGIFKCSIYEIIINLVVINLIWLIVYLFQNKKIIIRDMYLVILMVIILEQCVNFYIIVEGIEKESGFFKYDYVQEEVDFLNEQVNEIKEDDNDFYRIESNYIVSHNDAYALGYRGITNYTSVCNYKLNETLSDLGIRVNGWRVDYEGATPFLESIFNIKYMLHFAPRSWLEDKEIDEEFFIQENDFYLPVGFAVSDEIKKYKYSIDNTTAIERQNYIINCMLDNEESYYTVPEYECTLNNLSKKDNSDGSVTYEKINKTEKASISYKIPYTNKNNQYYYSYYYDIAKEYYEGHISTNSTVDSKNKTVADQELKVPRTIFINENISDDTDMLSVNIVIDEEKVTFLSEGIYELDMNKYKTVYNQLNQNVMQVLEYTNTSLKGTIETKENQLVFTSIPYDKGWTVQVDGKTQKTTPLINESFLGIEVPEGKHQIKLNYTPEGLKLGTIISIVGIITLIIYVTVPIKYYYMVIFN